MRHPFLGLTFAIGASLFLGGCNIGESEMKGLDPEEGQIPIVISGGINQIYETRADDGGFADGDKVGIYVVDYEDGEPGELKVSGNRANNLPFTYSESSNSWTPAHDVYWKDSKTSIDIYGYYPLGTPASIEEYAFEIAQDQNSLPSGNSLGGYESSDFLWGAALGNSPTDRTIMIGFQHKMASARITLQEGTGFDSAEWAAATKNVIMETAVRTSTINLKTGEVTPTGDAPATGTIAYRSGNDFRIIVVPQTIGAGKSLITMTVDGIAYSLTKGDDFTFTPGKQHNFTITVNRRTDTGEYEFVLSSESITPWENDTISHDAIAKEYVVVNLEEAGTLDSVLEQSGRELSKVKNLKLTGVMNTRDFAVIKYRMTNIRALNLKQVSIVAGEGGTIKDDAGNDQGYNGSGDDEIPAGAMLSVQTLTSIILPDTLKRILGEAGGLRGAFADCRSLSGSLVIPEGVVEIGHAAFNGCTNFTGTLILPSTLKKIGDIHGYDPYWDGPFYGCKFISELKLPEGIEVIGMGAFSNCSGLYGELHIPESVKAIGPNAFSGCCNITGSLVIPQSVTDIQDGTYAGMGLNGTLSLHDGIATIGNSAFAGTPLRGELRLPSGLETICSNAFNGCDFSGNLVIPQGVISVGDYAFAYNWRLMGVVEFPQNVITIGRGAFMNCSSLEGVIFPEGLESINSNEGAFKECYGIGRIVCKGSIPPIVVSGAFEGVPKDNFTLEVPESAIQFYQTAEGWKDFKRISAYRNLVVRPMVATAINTSVTRDLILNADDNWYVDSKPDWVSLDQESGTGKTELKLTFSQMPAGNETREGYVVFKLEGKDYTTRCKVSQYDYAYAEDEVITLHQATKGNGIDIMILGDGFDAKDVSGGALLSSAEEAYGHYFSIEPYKTYKDYFNVYTAVSVSPESGVGSVNTIVNNRFNTTAKGGVALGGRYGETDFNEILKYICSAPTISEDTFDKTLVIMVPNTKDYGGICYMYPGGFAIAYCPMSDYGYPLDFRGVVQHEAGGHGFAKLGDEYIYHNAFLDACSCTCCGHVFEFSAAKGNGWYANLTLNGKPGEVEWRHLMFHEKYRDFVDVYEGGYMHSRGVFRSEQNSCMNNDIPYYSTISREAMVRRIKELAGEEFSFEDFVENDVVEVSLTTSSTKGAAPQSISVPMSSVHAHPVFVNETPKVIWD